MKVLEKIMEDFLKYWSEKFLPKKDTKIQKP